MGQAIQGIVSPLVSQGALPGDAWFAALDALRPGKPLAIRGSIAGGADGTVDIAMYRESLQRYAAHGHTVYAVLEASIGRQAGMNPNDVLRPEGQCATNNWIESYSLTCCDTLLKLGDAAPTNLILFNEANIVVPHLAPGDAIPADKPEALSPQVAAAATWLTATRIRSLCPAVQNIYPAAMSDLVKFQTSVSDEWLGGWVTEQFQYLQSLGLSAPWPFGGLLVNQEGNPNLAYEQYIFYGLSHLKSTFGLTGPTLITEWGDGVPPQSPADVAAITASFTAMNSLAYAMFFFTAGFYENYGTWQVGVSNGELVPGTQTPWVPLLQSLYQGTI